MWPLDLAIELRCSTLDVRVSNSGIFDMPMELGLEFMAVIRAHFPNAERKLFNDMINEIDRIGLSVFFVDFECPDPRRVINGRILEPPHFFAVFPFESQKLNIDLYVMTRDLFLITFGVQFAHSCASGKPIETIAPENSLLRDRSTITCQPMGKHQHPRF